MNLPKIHERDRLVAEAKKDFFRKNPSYDSTAFVEACGVYFAENEDNRDALEQLMSEKARNVYRHLETLRGAYRMTNGEMLSILAQELTSVSRSWIKWEREKASQ